MLEIRQELSMKQFGLTVILMLSLSMCMPGWTWSQAKDAEYQSGTIVTVKPHETVASDGTQPYDVTVRVRDRDYVVLFTSPVGSERVKYSEGQGLLVKVGTKTLGFRDMLGRYSEFPILSSKEVPQTQR
jgi:hypothetical protein